MYGLGRRAAAALEDARRTVARILNCQPAEIVFTSCGTESDNLAIRGVGLAAAAKGRRHLITTPIEHHAVLHTVADLVEHFDFEVTHVPVDRTGLVDPAAVEAAIRPDTALISVMLANNEVGHRRAHLPKSAPLPGATAYPSTRTPCRPQPACRSTSRR